MTEQTPLIERLRQAFREELISEYQLRKLLDAALISLKEYAAITSEKPILCETQ